MKPWETPRMGDDDDDDDGTLGIICTSIYIYTIHVNIHMHIIYMMCNVYVCIQLRIYR